MLGHTDTIFRPAVASGPGVTVALPFLPTTADVNSYQSSGYVTEVAALTLPSVYLVDPYGNVALDTDLMHGVAFFADPQKVVYQLNPDATWSDGVPVSCDDFYLAWLANASTATDPKDKASSVYSTYQNTLYAQADPPKCSDGGSTVTVTFNTPTPDWQTLFQGLLPAHIVTAKAGVDNVTSIGKDDTGGAAVKLGRVYADTFGTLDPTTSVSAGPYVITTSSSSEILLDRNPTWWGNPAGPDSIRLIPTDQDSTALQAVRNGEADATSLTSQDPSIADSLHSVSDLTRSNQTWPVTEHLEFNMRGKEFTSKAGKALRQAVFSCIDRSAIVKQVARPLNPDAEVLGNMLVAPWDDAYTDHYRDYHGADVAKAKKLLQQAGWTLGKDGVFAQGKTKAAFTLGVLHKASRTMIGKLIQQTCKQAGIDVKVADIEAANLYEGKFQVALFGWSAPVVQADFGYTYASKSSGNTNGYSNAKVDALFADIAANVKPHNDSDRLNKIDQLMAADQAFIPLYDWTAINLQSGDIRTTVTNNYFWGGEVWDAYAWTVTG